MKVKWWETLLHVQCVIYSKQIGEMVGDITPFLWNFLKSTPVPPFTNFPASCLSSSVSVVGGTQMFPKYTSMNPLPSLTPYIPWSLSVLFPSSMTPHAPFSASFAAGGLGYSLSSALTSSARWCFTIVSLNKSEGMCCMLLLMLAHASATLESVWYMCLACASAAIVCASVCVLVLVYVSECVHVLVCVCVCVCHRQVRQVVLHVVFDEGVRIRHLKRFVTLWYL